MKSYSKNVFRTIIKNISRFILMTLITLVGIAFVTGVGGISPKVTNSFNENFKNTNVPDLIIKSKSLTGFSQEEIDKIKNEIFDINPTNLGVHNIIDKINIDYSNMESNEIIKYVDSILMEIYGLYYKIKFNNISKLKKESYKMRLLK